MKRFTLLLFMTICLIINLPAQKPIKKSNSPKENSTVKREYDDKGNLIKFDSTYTYSWSNDTSLLDSVSPDDFPNIFGNHFGFFSDSTIMGNSFPDEFDQMFDFPFDDMTDSLMMKKFGMNPMFNGFGDIKNDSLSSLFQNQVPLKSQQKSLSDMLKMMQRQMQEIREYQQKFFENQHQLKGL